MRHRLIHLALVALTLAACSDHGPTATLTRYDGRVTNLSLGDYIQQQIDVLLPKGFEDAVDARWSTVRQKKAAGDMAGARHHLNSLSTWIDKKTADITPPAGMTKPQGAVLLISNMARWLYEGEQAAVLPVPTGDVAVEVVPAGAPLFMQTPSQHAGVSWGANSTGEDRIVTLMQDPNSYPGHCNGPLPTKRCQYPLFYQLHTYPQLSLTQVGKFAVCMVETGDRRPLEYPADEANGSRPVDRRLRVAHNLPADPANYTPGATQEDGIEILPLSQTQTGTLINCAAPNTLAMNRIERALYAASRFAAKFISPEKAYAYDSGPEHDFGFTSSFNGVDPQSQPDLSASPISAPASGEVGTSVTASFVVQNTSRRMGGHATAAADATTATLWLSADQTLDARDVQLGTEAIAMRRPDENSTVSKTFSLPATGGSYYLIAAVPANASYTGEISGANNISSLGITVVDPEIPITLNLASVEKLPGGTQHFFVQSGSPGPYTWSVNGVDGGTSTYGTVVTNADFSADYTAPAAVPTPATFNLCASRVAKPTNSACATVTIKPVPSSGADVVVFNDLNMFDNTYGNPDPNNRVLYANLVTYTGPGVRTTKNRVWVHRGHSSRCGTGECSPSGWSGFENAMRAAGSGYVVQDVNDATGPLTSIPADVKVIILALPMVAYTNAEINSMKQFAGEGGRIIFVGEWGSYYGAGIGVENDFLTKMGAVLRNNGGAVDCGRQVLPASSIRSHQVTAGVVQLTIACASVVVPGPNDYALFYNKPTLVGGVLKDGTLVLGAVAKVDLTPLSMSTMIATSSTRSSLSDSTTTTSGTAHSWGYEPPPSP